MIMLLAGCAEQESYELKFKDEMVLDYGSNQNTISLIEAVGNTKITQEHIRNNTLEVNNFVVVCNEVDTNKLGNYEVTYQTNATEHRLFTKTITVKDIAAPKISILKKELNLTMNQYKKYNFAEIIKIEDNWKGDDPIVTIKVNDVVVPNKTYKVEVKAKDVFGNEAKDYITLNIKPERKKEESKKKVPISDKNEDSLKDNNPLDSKQEQLDEHSSNKGTVMQELTKKPNLANRKYLFEDGYTMDNVVEACKVDLVNSKASGICQPIKDKNGIYLGMELIFY